MKPTSFGPLALIAALALAAPAEAQNWKEAPLYGTIDVAAGFIPDPVTRTLRAGGNDRNPVSGSGCTGYINAAAPDYDLNYAAGSAPLYIYARSVSDLTLLVHDPSGEWHCSDDWEGTDPMVSFSSPSAGSYAIWVGRSGRGFARTPLCTSPRSTRPAARVARTAVRACPTSPRLRSTRP